jgi:hypothetical protein|tara:strand:+ start:469 stop:945 length:477 start_codon:yes stop_codon:yes gene_type:complete
MFNFNLLPSPADNKYRGNKAAFWFFIAFVCLMTWRSILHMFFEEYGVHSIANIIVLTGDPDPMPLIYMFFSLMGFAQLIFCGVCWIIISRYRSLIPLMYVFWLIEWSGKLFLYPLLEKNLISTGIYTTGITPGAEGAPYVTILMFIFLILSMKQKIKE